MLRHFLAPHVQQFDGYNLETWFQQAGTTCHTLSQTQEAGRQLFPNKVILRRANVNWPPRNSDLSPLDYFLWGYLKSKVYENNPAHTNQLKTNIEACRIRNYITTNSIWPAENLYPSPPKPVFGYSTVRYIISISAIDSVV
ncbi:hypothetical protein Trydic_g21349 [Trypoxylus dichotomus]